MRAPKDAILASLQQILPESVARGLFSQEESKFKASISDLQCIFGSGTESEELLFENSPLFIQFLSSVFIKKNQARFSEYIDVAKHFTYGLVSYQIALGDVYCSHMMKIGIRLLNEKSDAAKELAKDIFTTFVDVSRPSLVVSVFFVNILAFYLSYNGGYFFILNIIIFLLHLLMAIWLFEEKSVF